MEDDTADGFSSSHELLKRHHEPRPRGLTTFVHGVEELKNYDNVDIETQLDRFETKLRNKVSVPFPASLLGLPIVVIEFKYAILFFFSLARKQRLKSSSPMVVW